MLPCADVEAAIAEHVGGHPVRKTHGSVRVRRKDQPVESIKEGAVVLGDGVDIGPHCFIHPAIIVDWQVATGDYLAVT
jgi:hypothetical protein